MRIEEARTAFMIYIPQARLVKIRRRRPGVISVEVWVDQGSLEREFDEIVAMVQEVATERLPMTVLVDHVEVRSVKETREDGDMSVSKEMPKYKCHKEVWALKIAKIEARAADGDATSVAEQGGATITPADEGYAPFEVNREYMEKHKPQVGGYYVVYKDGYKSFSPAEAFEDGYTLLGQGEGYPEDWRHVTLHVSPDLKTIHNDGDHALWSELKMADPLRNLCVRWAQWFAHKFPEEIGTIYDETCKAIGFDPRQQESGK